MARSGLIHHTAGCLSCDASVDSRDAMDWANKHANRNPGHAVEVSLGYRVFCDQPSTSKKD